MTYTTLADITIKLAPRLKVTSIPSLVGGPAITGITGSTVGSEIIEMLILSNEGLIDLYLGMLYVLPLKNQHPFVKNIAEKLIISETLLTYFPSTGESSESESYPATLRRTALNDLQCLMEGTGIFVPGSETLAQQKQNDENAYQQQVRNVILPGEELKAFIGHDLNGDGVSDTDLFKNNTNVAPSFYTVGDFNKEAEADVINGVRVRPDGYRPTEVEVDFW